MEALLRFDLDFTSATALVKELNTLFLPDNATAALYDSVRIDLTGQRYRLSIERQHPGNRDPNPAFNLRIFSLFLPVDRLGIEEVTRLVEAVDTAHKQLGDAGQIVALDYMGTEHLGSATDFLKRSFIEIPTEKKAANG